jgi:hypothetical protein
MKRSTQTISNQVQPEKVSMKENKYMSRRTTAILIFALLIGFASTANAATLSPNLAAKLSQVSDSTSVGLVIVSFQTNNGLNDAHLNVLRGVGITKGITLSHLGMVATVATAGQVRALAGNAAVRSVWSNDRLRYLDNETSTLTGIDRVRSDAAFTARNGGLPVSGKGPFSVVINDSGIDARHDDLKFGTHVIQNVQIVTDEQTLIRHSRRSRYFRSDRRLRWPSPIRSSAISREPTNVRRGIRSWHLRIRSRRRTRR